MKLTRKGIKWIIIIAVIILAIFGLLAAIMKGWFNNLFGRNNVSVPAVEPQIPVVVEEEDPFKEIKLSLRVDLDTETLDKMYIEFMRDFLNYSTLDQSDARTSAASLVGWSSKEGTKMFDAVSFPFEVVEAKKTEYIDDDIEAIYKELQDETMRNPVLGDMIIQGMKEMALQDKTTVAELNEDWVDEFLANYDEFGLQTFLTKHTVYWENNGFELPHDGELVSEWEREHPNAPIPTDEELEFIRDENGDEKYFVTEYYARTAKRILAFLDRCTIEGVQTYATTKHWPLNASLDANFVRTYMNEDKNYVEREPALVFSVRLKDDSKQLLFGFNIYDKRLMIYSRYSRPVNPPTPPAPNPPKPTPTPNPPGPNPTPSPEPTPSTLDKDPSKDPLHNDNAPWGGNEGEGGTNDQNDSDPSLTDMSDAHGGPDNNQGHSDPETVKPGSNPSETHDENIGNEDDGNTNTIEGQEEDQMDYGEEDHSQPFEFSGGESYSSIDEVPFEGAMSSEPEIP